jgi:very-short-patch-repair endonuclease
MGTTAVAMRTCAPRASSSEAERRLWQSLRGRRLGGFRFRRRHFVAGVLPAFYCCEARLAIDLDGPAPTPTWQHAFDARARAVAGVRVLRFREDDVLAHPDAVVAAIHAALHDPVQARPRPPACDAAPAPLADPARGEDALTSLLAALAASRVGRTAQ